MKWIIEGTLCDNTCEAINAIEENLDECDFDELLDELYGEIEVCGYGYSSGYVLKEVDPTAYRCELNDWKSSRSSEIMEELENMEPGDEDEIEGIEITCVDDDYEEDD